MSSRPSSTTSGARSGCRTCRWPTVARRSRCSRCGRDSSARTRTAERRRAVPGGGSGRGRAAGFEAGDELVEPELLQTAADGLEFAGAELHQPAALLAKLERLAQSGLARVEAPDDLLDARAGRLVGERDLGH